ncbi:hypothetical protein MESS2_1630002 [Mesorhizobium metallidurans STM 2683]|uniref:Uncharacterized protein n=1 Tax=Mesorhizobium metallidurans STM 2683 TaxID=1297569 RepID=M5EN87_9HYPH|nr:hypothetical protein MESS2_1630002 [Mesorhizobium metallidurans STM 2683]
MKGNPTVFKKVFEIEIGTIDAEDLPTFRADLSLLQFVQVLPPCETWRTCPSTTSTNSPKLDLFLSEMRDGGGRMPKLRAARSVGPADQSDFDASLYSKADLLSLKRSVRQHSHFILVIGAGA